MFHLHPLKRQSVPHYQFSPETLVAKSEVGSPSGCSLLLDSQWCLRRHRGWDRISFAGHNRGGAETGEGRRGEMLPAGRGRVPSSTSCQLGQRSRCLVFCFPPTSGIRQSMSGQNRQGISPKQREFWQLLCLGAFLKVPVLG